jgi:peptidoglycan-associated lipoprotein
MKFSFKHAALFAASFALVACSSVKLDGSQPDANTVKTVDVTNGIGADGVPAPANRTIYFDLDSYVVRPDGQTVVNSQAAFLLKNKSQHVMLQGHTDERGTTEYNIALGQRRSESVRQALALQGVQANQMEAVSVGKEKPAVMGSDESAWSKNRRVELVY